MKQLTGLSYGGRCLAARFGTWNRFEADADLYLRFAVKAEGRGDHELADMWMDQAMKSEKSESGKAQ